METFEKKYAVVEELRKGKYSTTSRVILREALRCRTALASPTNGSTPPPQTAAPAAAAQPLASTAAAAASATGTKGAAMAAMDEAATAAAAVLGDEQRKSSLDDSFSTTTSFPSSSTATPLPSSSPFFIAKFISNENINEVELEILPKLNHPNIVTTVDIFRDATSCVIVMEELTGGDLFSYLENSKGESLNEDEVAVILKQVLKSVAYLHQHGIVHRDIKLENICRRGAANSAHDVGEWCLVDFGFCARIDASERLTSCCGSPNYMAPEMLRASRSHQTLLPSSCTSYSTGVDVWAVGVVLYVLMCKKYPFFREQKAQWHKSILLGQFSAPPSTAPFSTESMSLLHGLLEVDTTQRLTAAEALHHAFLSSFSASGAVVGCSSSFNSTPAATSIPCITPEKVQNRFAAEDLF